jgi:hypothetical protein
MSEKHRPPDGLIALLVLLHLAVTVLHGRAHTGADVPVSTVASIFILTVIIAAPLVGLVVLWFFSVPGGAWLLAVSLAGSLVFGVVNHFVLESPDHVAQVAAQWRVMFGTTAVLLAVTEALGSGLAFWRATHVRVR